jgi:hypothetical protein
MGNGGPLFFPFKVGQQALSVATKKAIVKAKAKRKGQILLCKRIFFAEGMKMYGVDYEVHKRILRAEVN